jgi:hypothetical protein
MKRRRSSLKRRYGRAASGHRWASLTTGVYRLVDVPPSKGEVMVFEYPHFAEVSVAPATGRMSAEMSLPSVDKAKKWGEEQAKRMGFLESR